MELNNDSSFPYTLGVQYKPEHSNSFDAGRVPESVKEETDTLLHLKRIGEQYFKYTQAGKRENRKDYRLLPQTKHEQETEEKLNFLRHLQVKPNVLRFATTAKVWTNSIVVFLGMIAELFIYQSIAENAFNMSIVKSYFIGVLVLLFTKFVQVSIQKHIKYWIKENNILFRSVHKTLIFVFVGLIFLNAMMLGITNLNQINQLKKIEQIECLSSSIDESQEYGEDSAELETELNQLQAELHKDVNGFFTIAKFISIALIGLLAIGCGATLFVFADLYRDALKLQKDIQNLKDRQAELRANVGYFLTTNDDLLSLQKEILQMFGQKHFLEKLLSSEREKDLQITTE